MKRGELAKSMEKYGLVPEQYYQLLRYQDYRCAICRTHKNRFKKRLAVDHDHVTGKVRGLLCYYCNRYVVGRHRRPELLAAAAEYLRNPPAFTVFKAVRVK